jgi:O-antigen/teichoic acid export membrane protein
MTSGLIYMGGIYSSQYIITHFVSLSEAGIYSVSANLGNLLNFFIAPLSFIVFPLLVKFWANHDTDRIRIYLSHSIELFLFIAVPASGGLCILSQYLITIFANSSYAAGSFLVLLISLGTIFSGIYIANVSVMQLTSQTRWIPIMVLASSSVLISGNIILIPLLGITGSGIAYALSYFVLATIATIYAVKYTHYRISSYFVLKIIASTSIMILALSLIPINSWLSIVLAIIVGIITYSISIFLFRAFSRRDLQLFREIVTNMLNSNISA